MSATFGRSKVWAQDETIKTTDLNAEFDNILNNLSTAGIGDLSADVSEMQQTTDPGEVGSESLATSVKGEIERLRFLIKEITGNNQWYESPTRNLSSNPEQLSGLLTFDAEEGEGEDTTGALKDYIRQGGIINALSWSSADIQASDFTSSNSKFGTYSLALGTGVVAAYPDKFHTRNKGSFSIHARNLSSSDYITYNPLLGMELFLDGSGNVNARLTEETTTDETTKTTQTITGSTSRSGGSSFHHYLLSWVTNSANGSSSDELNLKFDGSSEGTQLSNKTFNTRPGANGFWLLGAKKQDPTWTKESVMRVLPDAESSNAWSETSVTQDASISSDGILNINTVSGGNTFYYERTSGIDLTNMTIDFKMRLVTPQTSVNSFSEIIRVEDNSETKNITFQVNDSSILIGDETTTGSALTVIPLNTNNWNIFRIVTDGSTIDLYINGIFAVSIDQAGGDSSTSSDYIRFGDINGDGLEIEFEHFKFASAQTPPVTTNNSGNLSDLSLLSTVADNTVITSLGANKAAAVFSRNLFNGLSNPFIPSRIRELNSQATLSSDRDVVDKFYYVSDGQSRIFLHATLQATLASDESVEYQAYYDGSSSTASNGQGGGVTVQGVVSGAETFSGKMVSHTLWSLPGSLGLHDMTIRATGGSNSNVDADQTMMRLEVDKD